nr:hypothetical protein [Tanacetum cinerariifolium]
HWANYLGELVRELPLHYPSWRQMPPERKAGAVAKIGHLQKIYNGKKAALKESNWVPEEDGSYDLWRPQLPVVDPHLLLNTYCWRRILEPRGQRNL